MVHLRLVAGTDVTGVPRIETSIKPSATSAAKSRPRPVSGPQEAEVKCENLGRGTARSTQRRITVDLEEEAREALRNLKLPGQEKTVGELRDEVSRRCRKRSPSNSRQRAMYERLEDLMHSMRIFLRDEHLDTRSWDRELRCVVGWPDELVAAHPEFKPYAFVLEDLVF